MALEEKADIVHFKEQYCEYAPSGFERTQIVEQTLPVFQFRKFADVFKVFQDTHGKLF